MSGPYCESCKHYSPFAIVENRGECTDPTKPLFLSGMQVTAAPEVNSKQYCNGHQYDSKREKSQ